jgi:hypothetical protein
MTLIALVPYKDGILSVSDSRCNTYTKDYKSIEEFEENVYREDIKKTFISKDRSLVVSMSGAVELINKAVKAVLNESEELKRGNVNSINELLASVIRSFNSNKQFVGATYEGGLLIAVKRIDGTIWPLAVTLNEDSVNIDTIDEKTFAKTGLALGVGDKAAAELEKMISKYSPDASARTKEDAMAIATMLETVFMNKRLPMPTVLGDAHVYQVGAPIRMHTIEKDSQLDILISEDEVRKLKGSDFSAVKKAMEQKIKDSMKFVDKLKGYLKEDQRTQEPAKKPSKSAG